MCVVRLMSQLDTGCLLAILASAAIFNKSYWLGVAVAFGGIHLVERRHRSEPLHPARQIALSSLIESMPEAVLVVGDDMRVVEMNQAAEKLVGRTKEQLQQIDASEIARQLSAAGSPVHDSSDLAMVRALHGETIRQEHRRIKLPDGSTFDALVSANPIRDQENKIVGALVIVRDITELVELQQHREEAERHSALGVMAASLTHDFNNVLDTISKAATVLEVAPDRNAEERAVILRMIQNAVKRGAEIVSNVRRYLTGAPVQSEGVDLDCILEEALELTRPMWQSARISLVRQVQPVPKVRANPADLRRVFTNLIINAIEAMPEGGTMVIGSEKTDGSVRAFVQDTGKGIPPEAQSRIFAPYYTTKQKGTGLGLSSALRMVNSQQGKIWFVSRPGEGTRFVVEFPVLEESETQIA